MVIMVITITKKDIIVQRTIVIIIFIVIITIIFVIIIIITVTVITIIIIAIQPPSLKAPTRELHLSRQATTEDFRRGFSTIFLNNKKIV